ncbi:MAG: hypothetical protein ACOX8W_02180 [bacterium]|jgi:chemotaxis regulatin CheY-phosphate phosphatase CheZ
MKKQRILVYKTNDYATLQEMVRALDEKYYQDCQDVSLFRRLGKYCIRVTASAAENTLDAIEALMANYGTAADLNLTALIRESESMVAETGFDYVRNGGIL